MPSTTPISSLYALHALSALVAEAAASSPVPTPTLTEPQLRATDHRLVSADTDPDGQLFVSNPSGVLAVEKRKLKSATASPGTTLVAPVPEFRLETWKVVGGKYSLPRSHSCATSSVRAGASE